nr:hydrogenase maturation protease [candidate division Zixibacteria bacterium]
MKPLILGLGNELLCDDGIGIIITRKLPGAVAEAADVIRSGQHGVALLDLFLGYRQAIIIDAIQTGKHPPGTVLELIPGDLNNVSSPSPHYTGIPELIRIAREMQLDFPDDIRILAVEIEDPLTVGGELTPAVEKSIEKVIPIIESYLYHWRVNEVCEKRC